jgi:hypothetical protein
MDLLVVRIFDILKLTLDAFTDISFYQYILDPKVFSGSNSARFTDHVIITIWHLFENIFPIREEL